MAGIASNASLKGTEMTSATCDDTFESMNYVVEC